MRRVMQPRPPDGVYVFPITLTLDPDFPESGLVDVYAFRSRQVLDFTNIPGILDLSLAEVVDLLGLPDPNYTAVQVSIDPLSKPRELVVHVHAGPVPYLVRMMPGDTRATVHATFGECGWLFEGGGCPAFG